MKFSVSAPPIGGVESGIDFDPADPRKDAVLRRHTRSAKRTRITGTAFEIALDPLVQPRSH